MTRAFTLGMLLCALALTAYDRRPSPNPSTPQMSRTEKVATAFAKAVAGFKCPALSGRSMIDDDINRGSKQPVCTNCTTAYATCGAQSHVVFDHCLNGQVFDQRFSICVVKDACDETKP